MAFEHDLERRIGGLELRQAEYAADLRATRTDVERLTAAFESFATDVRSYMRQSKQTDWKLVIAAIGAAVLIGGIFVQPLRDQSSENARDLEKVSDMQRQVIEASFTDAEHEIYVQRHDRDHSEFEARIEDLVRKAIDDLHDHELSLAKEGAAMRLTNLEEQIESAWSAHDSMAEQLIRLAGAVEAHERALSGD